MRIDENEVKYIAKLAKLNLKEEEIKTMVVEFQSILNEFESLNNLDLQKSNRNNEEEMCRMSIREDEWQTSNKESLMSNVKSYRDGYIEVPKVIE